MIKYSKLCSFLIALIALFSVCNADNLSIVNNGKSDYTIILPEHFSKEELKAANFLNEHLQKISGCVLPITYSDKQLSGKYIIISKSKSITIGDGFSILIDRKELIIHGGENKGCLYGVTELLENYLGVRYYSPTHVIIPKSKNVNLPDIKLEGSSPNTYRIVNGDFEKDSNYIDFNRLHTINEIFPENYYVHTFNRLVPWKEYFASHPEYYALVSGKRNIDQLCLTNPDVLKIVLEKLKQEMLLQPDKNIWSVSQNDNYSYCQCSTCKQIIEEEKSPAGPVIRFVNQVAEQFPEKTISTLAYQFSRSAPIKTKPLNNVQVMLCTIELNRSKPIATDPLSVSFLKDLEDWGKICQHIYLWDYTVDFDHQCSPFPNLHVLQPNIQLFVKNNVHEHFQQTNTTVGAEFSELKAYVLAKLLWNPGTDVSKIIEEFTNGFYGPAAPAIRKYIYHLQDEILKTGEWLDIYGPPTNYQNTFLSAKNIELYNSYFDEAEQAVAGMNEYLLHVRIARMPLQYAMMEIGKNDMFGERGWYNEVEGDFILHQTMLNTLESFYQSSKVGNCKIINESKLTPEEYYHSTQRFINVQVKGNYAFRKKVTADPLPAEKYSGGNLSLLTNGVRGANDFKVHWLGWEGKDFTLTLDLEKTIIANEIELSSLWCAKSWILHPASVTCSVSENGNDFIEISTLVNKGTQETDEVNRLYSFKAPTTSIRFVKFDVIGTHKLFDWHPSAGGTSWVFVDEIVVK